MTFVKVWFIYILWIPRDKFDTWHALKQHIQRLNCPILMQQVGLTGAVATGASLEVRPSVAGARA